MRERVGDECSLEVNALEMDEKCRFRNSVFEYVGQLYYYVMRCLFS